MADTFLHFVLVILGAAVAFIITVLYFVAQKNKRIHQMKNNTPEKEDEIEKEKIASLYIKPMLSQDDTLLINTWIQFNSKKFKCDYIIVNTYGVFIVEAYNFTGKIIGKDDNNSWGLIKDTGWGQTFIDEIQNPLNQIEREQRIIGGLLTANGIDTLVEEYTLFTRDNEPFMHDRFVCNEREISSKIHRGKEYILSKYEIQKIVDILSNK